MGRVAPADRSMFWPRIPGMKTSGRGQCARGVTGKPLQGCTLRSVNSQNPGPRLKTLHVYLEALAFSEDWEASENRVKGIQPTLAVESAAFACITLPELPIYRVQRFRVS